ncbi:tumor necrosis factor receptor superfamily member 10B-like isoform X2 [Dendrobates tinctorius]|uniref:tumor necrosis factor receptor superfamily member 10B-like isoform X2 n=1 Tax=Dendrobates tinctorius TaxID=92724 RepID=UPI003CC96D2B
MPHTLVCLQVNMQFLGSYLCDLPIRCTIVLYLVNSIGCKPQITYVPRRNGSYYMNGNIFCLKCPAGNFVKKDCVISYTQGICKMCNPGENYSEHETGLNSCLTCTKCRADQEEISPCNITKNTVCQCKKGTYCPTNSTSNQCLPCRSSCPAVQVLQQTCNSTSDNVCVPVTPYPTGLIWLPKIFTKCLIHEEDDSEKDAKEKFLQQENKLYMRNDIAKDDVITRTCSIFVDLVPSRVFEKFVLELGLTKSVTNFIKEDFRATEEQHYAMLFQLSRKEFDVNIWLSKLAFIKLDNVAQEISTRLIEDKLFERSI